MLLYLKNLIIKRVDSSSQFRQTGNKTLFPFDSEGRKERSEYERHLHRTHGFGIGRVFRDKRKEIQPNTCVVCRIPYKQQQQQQKEDTDMIATTITRTGQKKKKHKTRQDATRQEKAMKDKTRLGEATQVKANQGNAGHDRTREGRVRQGRARPDQTRQGNAR
jgi:hypothetical protein